MPHSALEEREPVDIPGQSLAIAAEGLYLANMLMLPGPPFLLLLYLYYRKGPPLPALAACHLRQTISASLWAVVALVLVNAGIIWFGGYDAPYTWVWVVVYFVCAHTALVMLGILGLAGAMAGRPYRYPWVGRPCPECGC